MKATVTDPEVLRAIVPREIRTYLLSRGWSRSPELSDVWTLPTGDESFEVTPPHSRAARDYVQRVDEVVRTLALVEDRSELDVVRDLSTLGFDAQYIRASSNGPSGTAALLDVATAYQHARQLLAAAAGSVEAPRAVLPHRQSSTVASFMRSVLAGPSGAGSYVLSVLVPVPPRLIPEEDSVLFEVDTEPFERETTVQLHSALAASASAAAVAPEVGLDAFLRQVESGVSANLCEAIVGLAGDAQRDLEFTFAWALDRPALQPSAPIAFTQDMYPILREAARQMRARSSEEVRVRGEITRLHREALGGPGDVTIAGVFLDDPAETYRRVVAGLSQPEYQAAIAAHTVGATVEISGVVRQRGTRLRLENVYDFETLGTPP